MGNIGRQVKRIEVLPVTTPVPREHPAHPVTPAAPRPVQPARQDRTGVGQRAR